MSCTMPSLDSILKDTNGGEASPTSFGSGSAFSSETDYLQKSLSVWIEGQFATPPGSWRREPTLDPPVPLDICTAASIGKIELVKTIVESSDAAGRDLNRRNRGGWTPLMYAAHNRHDAIVSLLLDHALDVDVNVKSGGGKDVTALILAASCGNESICQALIRRGADVDARDRKGWTPLFHATNGGHANVVQLLLREGAAPECYEPKHEFTPLMLAVWEKQEMIVKSFLDHATTSADAAKRICRCVAMKNAGGDTARSIALKREFDKIVSLIDEFLTGARSGNHRRSDADNFPSILDGPKAFEKLVTRKPNHDRAATRLAAPVAPAEPEPDADDDPFGNTAAVTVRSNGSRNPTQGLATAFGERLKVKDPPSLPPPTVPRPHECDASELPDLSKILASLGQHKYLSLFEEQDIDFPVFLTLTDADLKEIGVNLLGPRRKMTSAIARFNASVGAARDFGGEREVGTDAAAAGKTEARRDAAFRPDGATASEERAVRAALRQTLLCLEELRESVSLGRRRGEELERELEPFLAPTRSQRQRQRQATTSREQQPRNSCDICRTESESVVDVADRFRIEVDRLLATQAECIEETMRRIGGGGGGDGPGYRANSLL